MTKFVMLCCVVLCYVVQCCVVQCRVERLIFPLNPYSLSQRGTRVTWTKWRSLLATCSASSM